MSQLRQKPRERQWKHVVQALMALFILICFLMPMYHVGAWKNVSLKNATDGNGITMLSTVAPSVTGGLASIVRKAKLAEGVTTTIAQDATFLNITGIVSLLGLLAAAAVFVLAFFENLGVTWGKWRKPGVMALCVLMIVCVIVGMVSFNAFNTSLQRAAAVTDEALTKVTSKLYQNDEVPAFTVGIWCWLAMAGAAAMLVLQLIPERVRSLRSSLLWFVLPALTMYVSFVIIPAVSSIYLGFTSYDGITEASMRYIGFDNYVNLFQSARFGSATLNTIVIALAFTVLVNILSLALAMAVDKVRWIKNIFRAGFYLPVLVSGVVAGFIWRIMFNYSFGVVNYVLNALGMNSVKFIDIMPNA